jgi:hypothetical protein
MDQKAQAQAEAEEQGKAEARKKRGKQVAAPSTQLDLKAQKNFTDPESSIMKTKDGFIQGYNAQAAVNANGAGDRCPWPRRQAERSAPADDQSPMRSRQIFEESRRSCRPMGVIAPTPVARQSG